MPGEGMNNYNHEMFFLLKDFIYDSDYGNATVGWGNKIPLITFDLYV